MAAMVKKAVAKAKVPTSGPAMRVAVAKDVLKLIQLKLKVDNGIYLERPTVSKYCTPKGLQALIPKIASECTVCAKGAIALAHVHLFDHETSLSFDANRKACDIWGTDNANMIEAAFERWSTFVPYPMSSADIAACYRFGNRFFNPVNRLKAIMKNVIANNGKFVPTDLRNRGHKTKGEK
jgi:hypothetical protein